MGGAYTDQFTDATVDKIDTLNKIKVWEKFKRTSGMNVLRSTWALKIKRFPNELIRKFKARFYVCGDIPIEGVDFDEKYALQQLILLTGETPNEFSILIQTYRAMSCVFALKIYEVSRL